MAGTVTFAHYIDGGLKKVVATCTGDASDGSYPATALPSISGKLIGLETNPGSTGPTANYDITLPDDDGLDRLQGKGANRHTSNSEYESILIGATAEHPPAAKGDTLTLTLTNNSVNEAVVVVTLYYEAL